jgi:leucyl-tRNA synthetase
MEIMNEYDPKNIEKKWQETWEKDGLYKVEDKVEGRENYYNLVEFSYPSGNLHVGHWYAFAVPDILSRYKRMQGFNVLYPMGFDAFGLPAENAAIKEGANPREWTYKQMDVMRGQLKTMGAMFPWDREVVSCSPEYYKWTQWMFNQLLKNDLVYRDVTTVNWCPKDKTVLANEQVVDGCCDRCGTEVIQKDQEQWMIRITKYADRLIDDLDDLEWPNHIKASQKSWIGRSEGSEITFDLSTGDKMPVFTTRADTLFGVTYVVIAPEHDLVQSLKLSIENWDEVEKYITDTKKKSELDRQQSKEKTGVELKGLTAKNPANGEDVPVWISDYVLAGYGTGAVMAVPAHDERDFEFANKFGLSINQVVAPTFFGPMEAPMDAFGSYGVIRRKSDGKVLMQGTHLKRFSGEVFYRLPGGTLNEGETHENGLFREIEEETGYKFTAYEKELSQCVVYHSKRLDGTEKQEIRRFKKMFLLSFEGAEEGTKKPDDYEEGFVYEWMDIKEAIDRMESNSEYVFKGELWALKNLLNGKSFNDKGLLVNSGEFNGLTTDEAKVKITEKVEGELKKTYRLRDWGISRQRYWGTPIPVVYDPEGVAHPVPDEHLPWTLPEDVDHTPDGTAPLARSVELKNRTVEIFGEGWTPEVETMDTFVDSTWYFYRYLDSKNGKEFSAQNLMDSWMPIDLYMGGQEHTTMHVLYSRFWTKAMYDLGLVKDEEAFKIRINRGMILGPDGTKMSKSKGNVINPDELVERLGADTVRMYLCFMGPYGVTVDYPWDPNGVVGVRRFLERVWRVKDIIGDGDSANEALLHQTIEGITRDIENFKFNTAISKMMILVNAWEKSKSVSKEDYKILIKLLSPFAPHMTEELWREVLDENESIHTSSWPEFDPEKTKTENVVVVVQVNGKVRGKIEVKVGLTENEVMSLARADEQISKWLIGEPKKVIHIQDKLLNIVI